MEFPVDVVKVKSFDVVICGYFLHVKPATV